MKSKTAYLVAFILSIAGFLFAGFLSISKVIWGVCPLKEPCPSFFGQPACYYGFILFTALLVLSAILAFRKENEAMPAKKSLWTTTLVVSIIGILFAAVSTYKELSFPCPAGGCSYSLLLPTCIYGFLFFVGIFVFLLLGRKK
jgi:uncharacterized membrane protein